jgi:hypothetical protein
MDQTETIDTEETEVIPAGLTDKLRGGFALVQTRFVTVEERARAQWIGIPQQARTALDKLLERVRNTLDLPSRSELQSLVERIEALDTKLAALEIAGAEKPAPKKNGTKKTTGKKATGNKSADKKPAKKPAKKKAADSPRGTRRAKIKDAARRQKKRS